jgi:hypothetical protein
MVSYAFIEPICAFFEKPLGAGKLRFSSNTEVISDKSASCLLRTSGIIEELMAIEKG